MIDIKEYQETQRKRNEEKFLDVTPEERALEPDTPFYQCVAYYRGEITREELLDILSTWKYQPQDRTDGYDSLLVDVPGSIDDVERALREGLIDDLDDEDYSEEGVDRWFYLLFPRQRKFYSELLQRMEKAGNVLPEPAEYGTPGNPVLSPEEHQPNASVPSAD